MTATDDDDKAPTLAPGHNVFRLGWKEGDTPVSVEPLRVNLKPGTVPTACKQRRYPPADAILGVIPS